jgi:hypothetical protein
MLHQYTPERGEVIRAAKGTGLTRPVCELSPRDALVFRAIVGCVEDQLLESRAWVGHARSDKGSSAEPEIENVDSFDWFQFWLRRQGLVANIVDAEQVNFIVESDISNFFPSIRLDHVREHLLSHTRLSKELVRLCMQMIDGVLPRSNYLDLSHLGLPQGNNNSSRAIAHSLLVSVDEQFDNEGRKACYTRFMDDVLFGAKDEVAGARIIARLQIALESLALSPNAAKTKIVPVENYIYDSMVETNGKIERLESVLESTGALRGTLDGEAGEAIVQLSNLAGIHRAADPRPRRWARVTRRLSTLQRRVGLDQWREYWGADLAEDPAGASVYFEYLRAWPLDSVTVDELFLTARRNSEIYTNFGILTAETMASAPVSDSEELRQKIFRGAIDEIRYLASSIRDETTRDRLCSSWFVTAWKFSNKAGSLELVRLASQPELSSATNVRLQAAMLRSADPEDNFQFEPRLSIENSLSLEYLRRLRSGESDAIDVALSLMLPKRMLAPQRYMIHARSLMLFEIAANTAPDGVRLCAQKALRDLQKNESRLRDHRTERILMDWQ